MSTYLCGESTDPSSDEKNNTTTSNLYKLRYKELSIHIYWGIYSNPYLETHKNYSHIINDISIFGRAPHSGNSQRFKLDAESPNMSAKDIELL